MTTTASDFDHFANATAIAGDIRLGRVALLPWDAETFGFEVADYAIGDSETIEAQSAEVRAALVEWSKAHEVRLIGAVCDANDHRTMLIYETLGFRYVDTTVKLRYAGVHRKEYSTMGVELHEVNDQEIGSVVEMAGGAFRHGRYHADPRFPDTLANKRYQDWVQRAHRSTKGKRVLATFIGGELAGFSVVRADGAHGSIELLAASPLVSGAGVGVAAATMRHFQTLGVRTVASKVSAANTSALNLHVSLGARCLAAELLVHGRF